MKIAHHQQNGPDRKGTDFLLGILGVYSCFWSAGYLQQKIIKQPYSSIINTQNLNFDSPISLVLIQAIVAWVLGFLINKKCINTPTKVPKRKMVLCAILITVSGLSSILAIKITSFPIVMMIKSCSIIPVVFVGIFFSKVKDDKLRLGVDKIVVALFISLGILIYNFGGDKVAGNNTANFLGVFLFVVSILADGFLPDIQAVIKSEFNPSPTQMFEHTNKWIAVISLLYALLTGQIIYLTSFAQKCPQCMTDLLLFSLFGAIGQIFIYRMIKQFKQHIVPFVITTRKIFTVIISILIYKHSTTKLQIVGIAIIFISASYQYCAEIFNNKKDPSKFNLQNTTRNQNQIKDIIVEESQTSQEKLQQQ